MRAKEFIREAIGVNPPAKIKPEADVGQKTSTGGQAFQTPQGTKHLSSPTNPNQKAPPTQADLKAQIRANQEEKLKYSSFANLAGAKNNKTGSTPPGPTGIPLTTTSAKKPVAPAKDTDIAATAAAMKQAFDTGNAAGQSPQDIARSMLKVPPTKIEPTGTTPTGAPSLGSPAAKQQNPQDVQNIGRDIMKNIAKTGITPYAPQNKQPQGFLGGLAQGFKKGMGMDTDKSLVGNLAGAGLEKLGLGNAASAATSAEKSPPTSPPGISQLPKAGQTIKDPITGKGSVKVMPNPGGKGVKLDTTKTLGYPIVIDPKDLA